MRKKLMPEIGDKVYTNLGISVGYITNISGNFFVCTAINNGNIKASRRIQWQWNNKINREYYYVPNDNIDEFILEISEINV